MQNISREQLKQLMDAGNTTVVEVLDEENFWNFHIPDAINVPLSGNFEEEIESAVPNKAATVVVYCLDADCDASPQAATLMEDLGYQNVFDYEGGKVDWKEAGFPVQP